MAPDRERRGSNGSLYPFARSRPWADTRTGQRSAFHPMKPLAYSTVR